MIQLLDEIPSKKPIVKKVEGEIIETEHTMRVGDTLLSPYIAGKLRKRQGKFPTLQDAVNNKEIYILGRNASQGMHWFGLVSGEFRPLSVEIANNYLGDISREKRVRYDPQTERYQVGYAFKESKNKNTKLMVYADSGEFGTYGGNGESAFKYGIALCEEDPKTWTLFQNSKEFRRSDKVVHRYAHKDLITVGMKQLQMVDNVERMWEENKKKDYTRTDVQAFAFTYINRCAHAFDSVLSGMNGHISGYELIQKLHTAGKDLSTSTRFGLEALAGEIVLRE